MIFFNKTSACALSLFAILFTTSIYSMNIFEAAEKGNIERIKELIAANPNVVNQLSRSDYTPLLEAVVNNCQPVVQILIANGANVNLQGNGGRTPLHAAAINNCQTIAKFLIANGADVNLQDNDGWTPLHSAAFWGNPAVAKILIANGAKVNQQNKRGETPLQRAADKSHQNEGCQDIVDLVNRVNAATAFAKTQLLALLCAGHTRLGVSSPLQPVLQDSQQVAAKIIGQFVRRAALEYAIYQQPNQ